MQEQNDLPPSPEKEQEEGEEEVEEKCSITKEELSKKQKDALAKGRNSDKAKAFKKNLMKEEAEEDEDDKSETVEELLNKTIERLQLNEDKTDKKLDLKEFKQNLTKEDVLRYIEKKVSKNPEVQKLIYEQAQAAAKKDSPAYILKEVAKILKK
jgi:hypothetical protein